MESRAHGVLGGKIGRIKSSNVNPGWLAEQLLAVDIVGPEDVEEANRSIPKPDRRSDLVETVMGNGSEGVFHKFVDILLNKPNLKWLGKELKDEFLAQGGVWSMENPPTGEPLTPAGDQDNHPTGASGPLIPAGDWDKHPTGTSGPLVPAGAEKPTLLDLQHFPYGKEFKGGRNIVSRIAMEYRCIGTQLLNDVDGSIVRTIHMTTSHVVKDTMYEIFYEWLQKDTECSWQKFIECLDRCELYVLANDIEDALKQQIQQKPLAESNSRRLAITNPSGVRNVKSNVSDLMRSDQDHGSTTTNESEVDTEENQHPDDDKAAPFSDSVKSQVREDSVKMVTKFSSLRIQTERYLDSIAVKVTALVTCIVDLESITYPDQNTVLTELRALNDVSDVFAFLVDRKLVSFLQYNIIEHIIVNFCSENEELAKMLKDYKLDFNNYVKRCICESSLFEERKLIEFDGKSDSRPMLVLVTDHSWDKFKPLMTAMNFRKYVVEIFGIKEFHLDLKSIDAKCLRFYFEVPSCFHELVFPLTPEQEECLWKYGITKIQYGQVTLDIGADNSTEESKCSSFASSNKKDFCVFGHCLGLRESEIEGIWNEVYGKFDKAMLALVLRVLQSERKAEEVLASALTKIEDRKSAAVAAKGIERALLTVDCLVIMLKDVQNWFKLGELLKMDEDVLKSIDDYYTNKGESFLYHLISNWFRDGPEEPLKLLTAGLRSLGEDDIATAISQLFSFGKSWQKWDAKNIGITELDEDEAHDIGPITWRGHKTTLTSVMAVIEKCKNLNALCEAMKIPEEGYEELYKEVFIDLDDRKDTVGKISSFWLEQNPSWQQLREHLTVLQENDALEINEMMESYNHEDAPLNVKNLMRALGPVSKWKTFCNSLNIKVDQGFFGTYEDKQETMQYFLDNPHCQVSWKRVALQLYHHMEERALDNLFNFIKSPHEFTLNMKNMEKCVKEIRLCMWKVLHQELRVPPRHNADEDCTISGVKVWLLTEPTASWQKFAMALYSSTLDGALKCLKNLNLLPYNDERFTIDNIMLMIEEVNEWEVLGLYIGIREPKSKFDKIKQQHEDTEAQKEEMIQLWYDTHPLASWNLLHQALSMMGETKAAQEIQEEFLQGPEHEAEMNVMQCVFTGPPRVGKSSFWKRMIGKMPDKLMLSTDITDGSVRLDIRGSCGFSVHVSKQGWRELQVEEEVEGFVALVSQQGYMLSQKLLNIPGQEASAATSEDTTASDSLPVEMVGNKDAISVKPVENEDRRGNVPEKIDVQEHDHTHDNSYSQNNSDKGEKLPVKNLPLHGSFNEAKEITLESSDIQKVSVILEKALINMKQAELVSKIDSASYVYFTDTGGQPEFQELLSLVMAGCNTVLIVFNLQHDLDSNREIEYQPYINEPPICYDSPCTVGEMLCQSLMSVPIMEHSNEGEVNAEVSQGTSRVFFVGTHKDLVSPERIEEMNRILINLIRETPQYQAHIVQLCKGGNVIFAVDNFSQNNEDFLPVREATQSLIYGNDCFKVKAPISWLFTGIVLKKVSETQPIVSFDQCKEIARQCGIQNEDDFDKAIKFLHYKIGVIRYYNTESLKGVVVLKPQLIINVLSQLMKEAFSKPVTTRAIFDDETIAKGLEDSKFVQKDFVLQLTKDLLLLAPHPESTVEHPKYYLTCMLPIEKASPYDQDDTAILFTRKAFSFPIGLCRAVITAILQNRMQTTTHWKINYQKLFRNSLEFTDDTLNVTFKLKCTNRHLSLSIVNGTNTFLIEVRKAIESIMIEAMKIFNYGGNDVPIVGFICPDSDMITPHYSTLTAIEELQCLFTKKTFDIPDKLQQWIMDPEPMVKRIPHDIKTVTEHRTQLLSELEQTKDESRRRELERMIREKDEKLERNEHILKAAVKKLKQRKRVTPEQAQQILQQCLEGGYLNLGNLKGILTGKARSGKSHSKARFFNMEPPTVAVSTGVAEGAVKGSTGVMMAGVRGISHDVICARLDEWFCMSPQQSLELLAQAVREGLLVGDLAKVVQQSIAMLQAMQLNPVDTASSTSQSSESAPTLVTAARPSAPGPDLVTATTPSPLPQICTTQQQLAQLIEKCPVTQQIFELQLMHFVDSGGQPQFHEVLPAFIHNTALIVVVLNLSEELSAYSQMEFCDEKGKTHKEECASLLNNEEIMEHEVCTMQAKPSGLSGERKSMVVAVGTHRDVEEKMAREGTLKETRAQKNEKLCKIFLPWLLHMLILYRPPGEVIFPVNMLKPDDDDWQVLRFLRQKIMEANLFTTIKIPVGWFLLEQDILKFAAAKGRKIVLVSECVRIAGSLKIIEEILEAALLYFHSLNVFLYCPQVLPGLVFIDLQVPLNCVYELVAFQFKMSCGAAMGVAADDYERLMKGAVTLKFMKSKHFTHCFVSELYEPRHALKLFQSLFIAAPLGNGEYLMPFLLKFVPKAELHTYLPSHSFPVALLMLFRSKSTQEIAIAPNGTFCGLVACLISKYKWSSRATKCLARNIAILSHAKPPVTITLVNRQSFFSVYVQSHNKDVYEHFCPELRQTMFDAVDSVMTAFKYNDSRPTLAFPCPCDPEAECHAAVPQEYRKNIYLSCSKSSSSSPLTAEHKVWMASVLPYAAGEEQTLQDSAQAAASVPTQEFASKLDDEPTLLELLSFDTKTGDNIDIIDEVGDKYLKFGILLLEDKTGTHVRPLIKKHSGDRESINLEIVEEWLQGRGAKPVSWRTLTRILKAVKLTVLAQDITDTLSEAAG